MSVCAALTVVRLIANPSMSAAHDDRAPVAPAGAAES
jgi:hypothetical protein